MVYGVCLIIEHGAPCPRPARTPLFCPGGGGKKSVRRRPQHPSLLFIIPRLRIKQQAVHSSAANKSEVKINYQVIGNQQVMYIGLCNAWRYAGDPHPDCNVNGLYLYDRLRLWFSGARRLLWSTANQAEELAGGLTLRVPQAREARLQLRESRPRKHKTFV